MSGSTIPVQGNALPSCHDPDIFPYPTMPSTLGLGSTVDTNVFVIRRGTGQSLLFPDFLTSSL